MRLFSFGFLLWVSALATAIQAETKIWAFSCIHEGDSNSVDILVQKDGKINLLSTNAGDGLVKEVQPNVFEFRNSDPLFVGYLRRIRGKWKYNISNAGIFSTLDCINLSEELNDVIAYYASSYDDVGGDEDLQNSLGARKLVDNLREENKLQKEENKKLNKRLERNDRQIEGLRTRVEALSEQLYTALSRAEIAEQNQNFLRQSLMARDASIKFKNEVFRNLSTSLEGQEGVSVFNHKIVFQADNLFRWGTTNLELSGENTILKVAQNLSQIISTVPTDSEWIVQVSGHTDISSPEKFRDNWELSQARALSVVRFILTKTDFEPSSLSANGFAQYQPVTKDGSSKGRAANRRIELTLVER